MADLMKIAEEAFATGKELPAFNSGDTITVSYKIKEGNKIGVERIFPMESPFIENVVVNKEGRVRRARLYYLRNLTGKAARIREKQTVAKAQ